jgi:ubiquinone/menaquinone biosynthesis C-methylase UbiE
LSHLGLSTLEALTVKVYGDTFALYNTEQFEQFLRPFELRFERNGINPQIFDGKRCLDAGCGGGRGSVFMARHGATEVVGVDLSAKNVATAMRRAAELGYNNLHFHQGSVVKLDFEDQVFDVVWCNGVLHHSDHPDAALDEISRVLKVDGYMWLYLYGSGGLYWSMVDLARNALATTSIEACILLLLAWNVPIGRIAEFIDDWYVPWLRRYTHNDVGSKLATLGFDKQVLLQRGTDYDTSERVHQYGEQNLWGEGDLRYFCQKSRHVPHSSQKLPDYNRKGSLYEESSVVQEFENEYYRLLAHLDNTSQLVQNTDPFALRVGLLKTIQTGLRDLMSQPGSFPLSDYHALINEQMSRLTLLSSD